MYKYLAKILFVVIALSILYVGKSGAYFTDTETISGITLTAGTWDTNTPTPTPTPEPEASAGAVVINEIMWMGSVGNSNDEWLELRNMTNGIMDLSGWQITGLVGGDNEEQLMLTIPSNKKISPYGYFLISRLDKATSAINVDPDLIDPNLTLRNSNLQIKLYKGDWTSSANLIDTADDGDKSPLKGVTSEGDRKSMERNDIPGDGTSKDNWHSCTDPECNDTTYWDTEGNNHGTPKDANHSGEPRLEMNLPGNDTISFTVVNISGFSKLSYQLTYNTNTISDGVTGDIPLSGQDTYNEGPLTLGTCSSGGTCVYYSGISNLKIKVILEEKSGKIVTLEQVI